MTPIRVIQQGRVLVHEEEPVVVASAPNIVCLAIDLRSKYAKYFTDVYGIPEYDSPPRVMLDADDGTAFVDESKPTTGDGSLTIIDFPAYPGWRVFGEGSVSKYTLRMTLYRPEAP